MPSTQIIDDDIWNALRPLIALDTDSHLACCDLAKRSGPHATLGCVECGRARWMHSTRHDTCGQFSWVSAATIPDELIEAFRFVPGVDLATLVACSRALNDFGLAPGPRRDSKRTVAAAINAALNRHAGPVNAEVRASRCCPVGGLPRPESRFRH
jgi:hypothetical protein